MYISEYADDIQVVLERVLYEGHTRKLSLRYI